MLIRNGDVKGIGVYGIKNMQGKVYYVGGTKDLGDAYSRHKSNLIAGRYAYTNKHLLQVMFNSENLIFFVLESCTEVNQDAIETKYIKEYSKTLLNRDKVGKHRKSKSTIEETLKRRKVNEGTQNPHNTKLNVNDVKEIKKLLKGGAKQIDLADKYDVSQTLIYNIKSGKRWASVSI